MSLQPQMLQGRLPLLFAKIRRLLIRRGGRDGIRMLARQFRVDPSDSSQICANREAFEAVLAECGVVLTASELDTLYDHFNVAGDQSVGVLEFLAALRGQVPPRRRAWITRTWRSLPKSAGAVPLETLHGQFQADRHPDVLAGRVATDEIVSAFQESFNYETCPDGQITKEDFESHYAGVSAGIDSDEHFALMMNNVWRLGATKRTMNSAATVSSACGLDGQSVMPLEQSPEQRGQAVLARRREEEMSKLAERIRAEVLDRPCGLRGLGQCFRLLDRNSDGFLLSADFKLGIQQYGLAFSDEDWNLMLASFDLDGDDHIFYEELLLMLRGDLPPRRKKVIERAFSMFSWDDDGRVAAQELTDRFHVYRNPVVVKGKRTAEQVAEDFATAFHPSNAVNGSITYEEFEEYFAGVSLLVANDKHYEIMLLNAWK
eukprot:NODE_1438_length_1530_cov_75.444294_g1299_i0.p1 GENE.NODE_1438_length_1530_cov_75.444294_g1299_i0~~NODE_1438_length_1530_cov_75.444294_g1299_i0.p1  ORF type:complete len:464 (+),score=75.29 NODE_1438_length_1530_cov_75.444294_g1299_i0:100-1392(+)